MCGVPLHAERVGGCARQVENRGGCVTYVLRARFPTKKGRIFSNFSVTHLRKYNPVDAASTLFGTLLALLFPNTSTK